MTALAWPLAETLKWVVVVAALVAVALIAVRAMGVQIPNWAVQMFWVVVIAAVAIFALHVLAGL